jgi:hypothetical protein
VQELSGYAAAESDFFFLFPSSLCLSCFSWCRLTKSYHSLVCSYLAAEFSNYLNYCRSLRFDDKPDYGYLRRLFRDLFYREGFETDFVFDWTILNVQDKERVPRPLAVAAEARPEEEKVRFPRFNVRIRVGLVLSMQSVCILRSRHLGFIVVIFA